MTPTFYYKFGILKRALDIFNVRCSCESSSVSIEFKQSIDTNDYTPEILSDINNLGAWTGVLKSNIIGTKTVFGKHDFVVQHLEDHIMQLSKEIIEAMAANKDEWYADKPEVHAEILSLYKSTQGYASLKPFNASLSGASQ